MTLKKEENMKRLLCITMVFIAFFAWFICPVLANSVEGVCGLIGSNHSGLSVFSNSNNSDLEKKIDAPGEGIGG
jgi:hypothetical protein